MASLTIEGIYKDGKIELTGPPPEIAGEARVLVTFPIDSGTHEQAELPKSPEEARREAGRRLMALLEKGIPFGGPPYPRREELYDRVNRFGEGNA